MNSITVCGNIGEPTLRFTKTGKAVLSFGLATTRKINDEERTVWHNVTCWDTLAENLAAVINKGDRLLVTGRIDTEQYIDKEGAKRTAVNLIADEAGVSMRWVKDR
jgi:single-strand DNA-binding protein